MPPELKNRYCDSIKGLAFAVLLSGMLLVTGSGLAWSIVKARESAFWLSVLVAMLATTSDIIATYSFVRYTQQPNPRSNNKTCGFDTAYGLSGSGNHSNRSCCSRVVRTKEKVVKLKAATVWKKLVGGLLVFWLANIELRIDLVHGLLH